MIITLVERSGRQTHIEIHDIISLGDIMKLISAYEDTGKRSISGFVDYVKLKRCCDVNVVDPVKFDWSYERCTII